MKENKKLLLEKIKKLVFEDGDATKQNKNRLFKLAKVENDIQTINSITDIKNFPSQSAKNIEILYSDSAIVKLKIIAPKMARYTNTSEAYSDKSTYFT